MIEGAEGPLEPHARLDEGRHRPADRARDAVVQNVDAGQRLGHGEDQRRHHECNVRTGDGCEIRVGADVEPPQKVGARELDDVDAARFNPLCQSAPVDQRQHCQYAMREDEHVEEMYATLPARQQLQQHRQEHHNQNDTVGRQSQPAEVHRNRRGKQHREEEDRDRDRHAEQPAG